VNAFIAELGQERPAIQFAVVARKYPPSRSAHERQAEPTKQSLQQCTTTRPSKPFQESDDELVGLIRAGDRGAFSRLVERYQRRVQQLALSLVRNEHDAQEVVQDAFLRVHLGLGGFRGTSSFYTWLYRIVVNLAIDVKRRPYRRRVGWESIAECADDSRSFELPRISNSDPHEAMSRLELDQRLTAALTQLAPYHRAVIVMREVDGMSYQEMAENLHISKGTVMSRLFHARRRLQHTLENEMLEH
jgi:RNA polymerase sigma-70 factor (ECF subfamily)